MHAGSSKILEQFSKGMHWSIPIFMPNFLYSPVSVNELIHPAFNYHPKFDRLCEEIIDFLVDDYEAHIEKC